MRVAVALGVAALAFGTARVARVAAKAEQAETVQSEPYAPSPASAPFLSLGYREALADVMFVRLRGYFGGQQTTPDGVASICEAVIALDPKFHRAYEYCGGAISFFAVTSPSTDQAVLLRAVAMLERGAREFPADWRLPNLAGQIYTQDLKTNDPAQRREWDERGTLLVESAIRKPGAPAELQDWAAVMRTKYGQQQRAIRDLREVLLVTTDSRARSRLIARLAQLQNRNADEIAGEIYEARRQFEREWASKRPLIPATWYVLVGPRLQRGFDPVDLATGGRDLVSNAPAPISEPIQE
jgi:hypothetical protein